MREIVLPFALLDVRPAALEMGQSVNVKRAVKINTCAECLLILDAPFRRIVIVISLNIVLCVKAFRYNYWHNVLNTLITIVANDIPI
ncbi:MAG: hypothetical protein ACXU9G_01850 [Syntrophales bacterium]